MGIPVRAGTATDLTQTNANGMTIYVGDAVSKVSKFKTLTKDGVNLSVIPPGSHTGTRADAPVHFAEGAEALDDLHVEMFVGEATVLDLSGMKAGSAIWASHLEAHAAEVREGDNALIKTDFKRWKDPRVRRRYTYLGAGSAKWLARKKAKSVGIDYLSKEGYGAGKPVAHVTLLSHGMPIIESLNESIASLGRMFFFVCLPINVGGFAGAPARAMPYPLEGRP